MMPGMTMTTVIAMVAERSLCVQPVRACAWTGISDINLRPRLLFFLFLFFLHTALYRSTDRTLAQPCRDILTAPWPPYSRRSRTLSVVATRSRKTRPNPLLLPPLLPLLPHLPSPHIVLRRARTLALPSPQPQAPLLRVTPKPCPTVSPLPVPTHILLPQKPLTWLDRRLAPEAPHLLELLPPRRRYHLFDISLPSLLATSIRTSNRSTRGIPRTVLEMSRLE